MSTIGERSFKVAMLRHRHFFPFVSVLKWQMKQGPAGEKGGGAAERISPNPTLPKLEAAARTIVPVRFEEGGPGDSGPNRVRR